MYIYYRGVFYFTVLTDACMAEFKDGEIMF